MIISAGRIDGDAAPARRIISGVSINYIPNRPVATRLHACNGDAKRGQDCRNRALRPGKKLGEVDAELHRERGLLALLHVHFDPMLRQFADHHILDAIPENAGPRVISFRGGAIYSVRPPGSQTFLTTGHCMGIMLAPARRLRASLGSDKKHEYDAAAGAMVINPANVDSSLTWSMTRENAVIALTPESLLELAANEFDAGDSELQPPPFGTVDPWALAIAERLRAELTRQDGANELYVDSLITLFGVHLLRNYTRIAKPPPSPKGGLSACTAKILKEFLAENFTRPLSVAELARVCGLSPRYFIRSFAKTFGEPPHQHLIKMRLAFAEELLLKGNLAIAEWVGADGTASRTHLYGIGNLFYDFEDGTSVDVAGTPFDSEIEALWGGLGLGGSYSWADDKYALYREALAKTSLEQFGDSHVVSGSVGFRASW